MVVGRFIAAVAGQGVVHICQCHHLCCDGDRIALQLARAAAILPEADANEHGTGYAADILSTDYTAQDTGFADTRAYQWLTAYAAEYGFILRYPEDRQAITGVVFEPWHWRYVGVENALAIRASGLSLEEFLAEQKAL